MKKTPKSFRFSEHDLNILEAVHKYYKENYEERVSVTNMDNLHNWTYAQTVAVCIRDRYESLVKEGKMKVEA